MPESEPKVHFDITYSDISNVVRFDDNSRGEWREQANCREEEADTFFPEVNDSKTKKLAKAVCRDCVVIEECLIYGLNSQTPERVDKASPDSIYGGLDGKERRSFKRRLRDRKKRQPRLYRR